MELLDILPEILPEVPELDDILALREIRRAARYFCHETMLLQHHEEPFALTGDEELYDVPLPADHDSVRVLEIFDENGQPLAHRSADQFDRDQPSAPVVRYDFKGNVIAFERSDPWQGWDGESTHWYQPNHRQFRLVPKPSQDGELSKVLVAVKPSRTALEMDDDFLEQWAEIIAVGAIAGLYDVPGRKFSDPNAAMVKRAEFERNVSKVRDERVAGFGRQDQAVMRVRAHP